MADRIGQQLGNYRLARLLGQGGFAEVYLGEHVLLGTKVAIKVLRTQVSKEDVAQFQQEARVLASLKQIASCSSDRTVQVWNTNDRSKVFAYQEHSAGVLSVAWSGWETDSIRFF
jgi:serine/threonine protein kinase